MYITSQYLYQKKFEEYLLIIIIIIIIRSWDGSMNGSNSDFDAFFLQCQIKKKN